MWALYTRALAVSPSAVQANVVNTSSNFVCSALLGVLLFDEKLPGMWWIGAGLLVAGTVVIGMRAGDDEEEKAGDIENEQTLEKKKDK
jgi:uncharacterized membrane protein